SGSTRFARAAARLAFAGCLAAPSGGCTRSSQANATGSPVPRSRESAQGTARPPFLAVHPMTLGRPISWASLAAGLALALPAGAGAARPAAFCVAVDPLLGLGCHG